MGRNLLYCGLESVNIYLTELEALWQKSDKVCINIPFRLTLVKLLTLHCPNIALITLTWMTCSAVSLVQTFFSQL